MNDFNTRDLFAALAMTGILANSNLKKGTFVEVAEQAYVFADAMIKEKEKRDAEPR
jgi:hypothetical protein